MNITGSCHCGAIAYEAELNPEKVGICHCTDCQKLSASAYRTVALVDADDFGITNGKPKEYLKIADSGNRRIQAFCSECGSGIYSVNPNEPTAYVIRVGTIDQRENLPPRFEIWHRSALSWLPEMAETIKHQAGLT